MDTTLRALNRFGLGARVGERDRIGSPKEWLRAQLAEPAPTPRGDADLGEISAALINLRAAVNSADTERASEARTTLREAQEREISASLTLRVTTNRPYVERLVAFWSNHLCVSLADNLRVGGLAGHYERTVIRRHVLGRFEDMVRASATHPAMLLYLDNFQSIGPNSRVARQAASLGRMRGLNENYARELLELHTLGVDGGYEQDDVEQLAGILTGWTVGAIGPFAGSGERTEFVFRPELHEPRSKTVLGIRYQGEPWDDPRPSGVEQGYEAIRDLCAHPSTARFVATKLVRHFVADDPPPSALRALGRAFTDSEGDLRVVSEALIDLEEAWSPEHTKFRAPQDWLVAALRAVHAEEAPEGAARFLRRLRQGLWEPAGPNGYGDGEPEWADPDALMNRAELATTLTRRLGLESFDPLLLLDVVDPAPSDPLRGLLETSSIPAANRVALALGAPAFQWR